MEIYYWIVLNYDYAKKLEKESWHKNVEIDGKLIKDNSISFINDEHIVRTIQRLIQPLGRTIDSANPMVDSRLSDGSRINAVIPPLSVNGPLG